MDIRSILMPLSSTGETEERLRGAFEVAKYFGAQLDILHAQANPRRFLPEEALRMSMPAEIVKQIEETSIHRAREEADKLRDLAEQLGSAAGVVLTEEAGHPAPSATWRVVQGLRSELVAELGKVKDLLIIPQPRGAEPTATFEAAIMRSGKPVLLVPRTMTHFDASKVMIAWNGSTEAARAVGFAIPVMQRAREVVIASIGEANFTPSLDDLKTYLSQHGISASCRQFDSDRHSTGKAILENANALGAELLVMGAFTHRRVHEQIFGGVTRYMVSDSKLPVLMAH